MSSMPNGDLCRSFPNTPRLFAISPYASPSLGSAEEGGLVHLPMEGVPGVDSREGGRNQRLSIVVEEAERERTEPRADNLHRE